MTVPESFVPPPYPYDRLNELKAIADAHDGGMVDLSIGTPFDEPPKVVEDALLNSSSARSYPPSIGRPEFRQAAADWLNRIAGSSVRADDIGATIGSKEFVAGLPHWLRLRTPTKDTVLYPAVSYPSYAMGATLAGCRAVPVAVDSNWRIDLSSIDPADAARALCLWVNSPGNPAGAVDDLNVAATWGRDNNVLVVSDECYIAFTWNGEPTTIVEKSLKGVLAVHSLSKRSNLAGARSGFYVGDPDLVHYLRELRKHAGFMQPGPVQDAAIAAFEDEAHVEVQRSNYHRRLELGRQILMALGSEVSMPEGGFYLWAPAPSGDAWEFAQTLATEAGILVSPGEFYGEQGSGHVRVAVVRSEEQLQQGATRLGLSIG